MRSSCSWSRTAEAAQSVSRLPDPCPCTSPAVSFERQAEPGQVGPGRVLISAEAHTIHCNRNLGLHNDDRAEESGRFQPPRQLGQLLHLQVLNAHSHTSCQTGRYARPQYDAARNRCQLSDGGMGVPYKIVVLNRVAQDAGPSSSTSSPVAGVGRRTKKSEIQSVSTTASTASHGVESEGPDSVPGGSGLLNAAALASTAGGGFDSAAAPPPTVATSFFMGRKRMSRGA